jgi:hypothetical protein
MFIAKKHLARRMGFGVGQCFGIQPVAAAKETPFYRGTSRRAHRGRFTRNSG